MVIHDSDDLGYPHDFTKKNSFRSVWTWVYPPNGHQTPGNHRGFLQVFPRPKLAKWPRLPSSDPGRGSWVPGPSWPRPPAPKGWGMSRSDRIKNGGILWRMDQNGPKKDLKLNGSMMINGFSHGLMEWPKGFFEEVMVSRIKIIPSAAILEHWDMTRESWNPKNV